MASSSNTPPPNDGSMQQYVDQRLQEHAQSFADQLAALGDQFQQLTAAFQATALHHPPGGRPAPNQPPFGPHRPAARVDQRDQFQGQPPPPLHDEGLLPRPVYNRPHVRAPAPRFRRFNDQYGPDPPPLRNQQFHPPFARAVPAFADEPPMFGAEEGEDDVDDELRPYRPPMDANQRENRRWESRFKLDIPEFHGSHNADDFLDWLTSIESVFYSAGVPSHYCVHLAAGKFRGSALAWWRALLSRRSQVDEPPIATWEELRREMKQAFLPYRYKQHLFARLCNLRQGTQSVQQYTETFYTLLARNEVVESNDKLVARYLSGLRFDLQDKLQGFDFLSVEQIVTKAQGFENQILRATRRQQSAPPVGRSQGPYAGRQPTAPVGTVPPRFGASNTPQSTTRAAPTPATKSTPPGRVGVTCFKCHQTGHMAANCPAPRPNLYTTDADYDVYDNEVYEETEVIDYEEEDLTGVDGQSLVTRPLLLTPRGKDEDWR